MDDHSYDDVPLPEDSGFSSRETEVLEGLAVENGTARSRRSGFVRFMLDLVETLVLAVVLYFAIDSVIARVRVENISMLPTLEPGEFVMVNKLAYKFGGDVERGDIVVFHYPLNPGEDYVKRVVGLPGETVEIRDGVVYLSRQPILEPYVADPPAYSGAWSVPPGTLFVLGDNRNKSSDSHSWGFVPMEDVVGRAFLIYWPIENFRIFE